MTLIRWAVRQLLRRTDLPVPPGTGQAIQDREAAAARARTLALARRRTAGHLYDGPAS
ncbi:hypothetical protein [Micromonospora craterilacus]|uniref:hypothetical protein n=1 Tax=Micromonospora craterilacus TaxID=1655439 RepID=UPI001313D99F|nr:hypothetical protein [Micromonospora craterilacus]